jgi:flagellar biosynthesis protein FlhF
MKIKRYVAADMRAALRAIREEQGADAVILSTRRTSEGVEVCSAIDLELAAGQGTLAETAALKQLERTALQELARDAAESAAPSMLADALLSSPPAASASVASAVDAGFGADRRVAEELRSLRNLLEQQVAALAWNDFTRREPLKARSLADLGDARNRAHAGTADRRRNCPRR